MAKKELTNSLEGMKQAFSKRRADSCKRPDQMRKSKHVGKPDKRAAQNQGKTIEKGLFKKHRGPIAAKRQEGKKIIEKKVYS